MTKRLPPNKDKFALSACAKDRRRFWSNVEKTEDCWLYKCMTTGGYGRIKINGVNLLAHRCAKLWASRRRTPTNWLACHLCRNANCVRPSHIYWGTYKQNYADMLRDGTVSRAHWGQDNKGAILTDVKVLEIYALLSAGGVSLSFLAKRFGVSCVTVSQIGNKRRWKHLLLDLPPITLTRRQRGQAFYSILSEAQVRQIKQMLKKGISHRKIAEKFPCKHQAISAIASGRNWAHVVAD